MFGYYIIIGFCIPIICGCYIIMGYYIIGGCMGGIIGLGYCIIMGYCIGYILGCWKPII
jgi:hypothetical protein